MNFGDFEGDLPSYEDEPAPQALTDYLYAIQPSGDEPAPQALTDYLYATQMGDVVPGMSYDSFGNPVEKFQARCSRWSSNG